MSHFNGDEPHPAGPIRVINKHRASKREKQAATYIGRGSPLGNPIKPGETCPRCGNVHGRGGTLRCYEAYLREKIEAEDEAICGALNRLWKAARGQPPGSVLIMCFCKPKRCHGDVVKQVIEENLPLPQQNAEASPKCERGYSLMGGYSKRGRGTPEGAEKDQAMRRVAEGAIVELDEGRSGPSSTRTTLRALGPPALEEAGEIVMLARNGSLRGAPLEDETQAAVRRAHEAGARFVVGDMEGVDAPFVTLLDELGARYAIYHAAGTPRIDLTGLMKAT